MARLNIYAVVIVFYLFSATQINSRKIGDEIDQLQLDYLCLKNEKLAKIQFYAQDIVGGPKCHNSRGCTRSFPSGKCSSSTTWSPRAPAPTQRRRASWRLHVGEYNGSSLSVAGRNEVAEERLRSLQHLLECRQRGFEPLYRYRIHHLLHLLFLSYVLSHHSFVFPF